jgi:uncharacterized protein
MHRSAAGRWGIGAAAAALLLGAATPALALPAMWTVSDADSKVFVFGSIHVLPPDTVWRTPAFDAALAAAPEVYFETDVGPLGIAALTFKMIAAEVAAAQHPWLAGLTATQRAELTTAITPLGLDLETASRMPPWAVEVQIGLGPTAAPQAGTARSDMAHGVDSSLQWDLPKERKAYLETPGQQFDLIAGEPLEVQVQHLLATMESSGAATEPTLTSLTTAWESGNIDALAFKSEDTGDQLSLQRLLYDRNQNWVPQIERLLRDNRQDLVVVGAAHLAGSGSVLDLLAKAGYTVTRVQ